MATCGAGDAHPTRGLRRGSPCRDVDEGSQGRPKVARKGSLDGLGHPSHPPLIVGGHLKLPAGASGCAIAATTECGRKQREVFDDVAPGTGVPGSGDLARARALCDVAPYPRAGAQRRLGAGTQGSTLSCRTAPRCDTPGVRSRGDLGSRPRPAHELGARAAHLASGEHGGRLDSGPRARRGSRSPRAPGSRADPTAPRPGQYRRSRRGLPSRRSAQTAVTVAGPLPRLVDPATYLSSAPLPPTRRAS